MKLLLTPLLRDANEFTTYSILIPLLLYLCSCALRQKVALTFGSCLLGDGVKLKLRVGCSGG